MKSLTESILSNTSAGKASVIMNDPEQISKTDI